MNPVETRSSRAVAVVGLLPALFWVVYGLSNVILAAPPSIGPFTAFILIYVAMAPALVLAASDWRAHLFPGAAAYAAFLAWVVLNLAWHGTAPDVEIAKQVGIFGMLGVTAAQLTVGGAWGVRAFGGGVMLVAVMLSVWTVGFALTTGFAYRGGVPVNPNLPATLIGPGLLTATAFYLDSPSRRALPLAIALVSLYGCLLLGSRGVLLGLLASAAAVWWRDRPALRRNRSLMAGSVAVVALSLVPAVPHGLWQAASDMAASWSRSGQPLASPVVAAAPAPMPASAPGPTLLDERAMESTALGRFGEEGVGSFNLRSDLWRAGLRYLASGIGPLLIGGGWGTSQALAESANPVFRNMHNVILRVATDFGLVGLALFGWLNWRILAALWNTPGRFARAGVACVVFWLVVGLTATVGDLHVYWVGLGAAAVAARRPPQA